MKCKIGKANIMELTELTLIIIILLTPGSIYMKIRNSLTGEGKVRDFEYIFEIIIISIFCYFLYSIVYSIGYSVHMKSWNFILAKSLNFITTEKININLMEVFGASILAFLVGFIASIICHNELLNSIGMKLKVTTRKSQKDVWYIFNQMEECDWVTIRDYKSRLYYYGAVSYFSDSYEKRELIMEDVTIYNDEAGISYTVDKMYFSRNDDDFSIEFTKYEKGGEKNDG